MTRGIEDGMIEMLRFEIGFQGEDAAESELQEERLSRVAYHRLSVPHLKKVWAKNLEAFLQATRSCHYIHRYTPSRTRVKFNVRYRLVFRVNLKTGRG